MFNEGSKIILRAAITILLMNKDKFLELTDFSLLCNLFKVSLSVSNDLFTAF
jgi:hypothetical protein